MKNTNTLTKQSNTTSNIPQLRFPEFKGEWEKKKLEEVATFSKGKGISKKDIEEDGKTPCIRYGELYTVYGEVIEEILSKTNIEEKQLVFSKSNDVIIPSSGESMVDIATASCVLKDNIALGGDLNIIRSKLNGVFLSYYLNSEKKSAIARLAQGVSVVHLYSSQLKKLKINIPPIPEQQKIAQFLTAIDTKIQQLTQKKALLQQYKKGAMQQIFSQQIRFKQDNGEDFSDWSLQKLGSFIVERVEFPTEKLPLCSLTIEHGVVPKSKRYERSFLVKDKGNAYKVMKKNDFALNPMNLRFGALARYKGNIGVSVSKYYNIFHCNNQLDSSFAEAYLTSYNLIQYYNKMATGSLEEKKRVHYSDFIKFKLLFPCLEEQQKIANFLTAIDQKINQVSQQITLTENYKKGLLQQLFV